MITRAQAEKTRADAERDIRAEGARVTLLYDSRQVDAFTGGKDGSAPRYVKTWALLGSYRSNLVDGQRVQQGDSLVTIADRSLAKLSLQPLVALDGEAASGYWLYLPGDPATHPEPTDPPPAGARRLAVVRVDNTVYEGGYPVLRVLQCR